MSSLSSVPLFFPKCGDDVYMYVKICKTLISVAVIYCSLFLFLTENFSRTLVQAKSCTISSFYLMLYTFTHKGRLGTDWNKKYFIMISNKATSERKALCFYVSIYAGKNISDRYYNLSYLPHRLDLFFFFEKLNYRNVYSHNTVDEYRRKCLDNCLRIYVLILLVSCA